MPIDIDDGVTCIEVTDGLPPDPDDICELFPDAPPPQPQFSAAISKTAINVIFFMTFSRFAIHGCPSSSGRIVVSAFPKTRNGSEFLQGSQARVELSFTQTTVLTYIPMQSNRRLKESSNFQAGAGNTIVSSHLRAPPPSWRCLSRRARTAKLTIPVNKNWHGGNAQWHQSGRGPIWENI